MRPRHANLFAAPIAFAIGACAMPDELLMEGEFVALTSSDDIRPCGGTLDHLDRFAAVSYRAWAGTPAPRDLRVQLELRASEGYEDGPFGIARPADHEAWVAAERFVLHETAHLITGWELGDAAPALAEGLAEAIGPSNRIAQWGGDAVRPEDYFFLPRGEFDASYASAAQLLHFLIERYGMPTVRDAYERSDPHVSRDAIEVEMVDAFGDSLYDAFDEFTRAYPCPLQAWECDGEVLPVVRLPLIVEPSMDCEAAGTLGAVAVTEDDPAWMPRHMFSLDLGEDDTEFRVDITDNAHLYFERCVATCAEATSQSAWVFSPRMGETVFDWTAAPGRYVVTVLPRDPALPFGASMVRTGGE